MEPLKSLYPRQAACLKNLPRMQVTQLWDLMFGEVLHLHLLPLQVAQLKNLSLAQLARLRYSLLRQVAQLKWMMLRQVLPLKISSQNVVTAARQHWKDTGRYPLVNAGHLYLMVLLLKMRLRLRQVVLLERLIQLPVESFEVSHRPSFPSLKE